MRKIVQNDFIKKSVALVLAVAMVVTGLYIVTPEASEVKASTTNGVSAADVSATWGQTPEAPGEEVVFAGWYMDAEYTQPLTEKPVNTEGTVYYPKWVDEGLLSLKLQIARVQGEDNAVKSYSLRLISSVDSLNYRQVGFYVYYNGSYVTKTTEYSALKEINAVNISTKYNYSPKVIDAEAERFFTVTLMGINPEKVDKDFQITPYWVTYDGVEAKGETRMFSVEDGYDTKAATPTMVNNVNVAIPTTITGVVPETVEVTVADATKPTTASVVGYANGYLSVNVPLDRTTLQSHTKIQYGDETVVYQNLLSKDETDTSWYDADPDEDKYVITTKADLMGIQAKVAEASNFANKEIYLVADMENVGQWTPIDTMAGTFDGQGHMISGLLITDANNGMFKSISGKVGNFTLSQSDIRASNSSGAIVGTLSGELYDIHADKSVTVKHWTKTFVAGLVGQVVAGDNKAIIRNCSFDGKVQVDGTGVPTGGAHAGIVAHIDNAECEIVNCVMSGSVEKGWHVGGLIGRVYNANSKVTIRNCLVTGEVSTIRTGNYRNVDTLIGTIEKNANVYIEDAYSAGINRGQVDADNNILAEGTKYGTMPGIAYCDKDGNRPYIYGLTEEVAQADIKGAAAWNKLNLDFYSEHNEDGVWVAIEDGLPKLRIAVTEEDTVIEDGYTGTTPQYGWYNLHTKKTEGRGESQDVTPAEGTTFELETAGDMLAWNSVVNSTGDNFSGDIVVLTDSVNLNPNWNASTKAAATVTWLAVGSGNTTFAGTFDGGNHTISGIYVNSTSSYRGMFALSTGNTIVKNFTLSNSYMNCGGYSGAIVGRMQGTSQLQNVQVDNSVYVVGTWAVGGLVGDVSGATQAQITDCAFAGDVQLIGQDGMGGGILGAVRGQSTLTIQGCSFTGYVTGKNPLGGMVGRVRETSNLTIENSLSAGELRLTDTIGSGQVGQIIGLLHDNSTVTLTNVDSNSCVCYKADGTKQASRVRKDGTFTLNDNDVPTE